MNGDWLWRFCTKGAPLFMQNRFSLMAESVTLKENFQNNALESDDESE
jgi:hypothetical protein